MKYTNHVIIHLPLKEVIEKFDNEENLKHWMPGLQECTLLEGEKGQVGAKTKMIFHTNKRHIEMVETITRRDLPHHFDGTYETKGVWNGQWNTFTAISENETKWESVSEFRMGGMMKIMGIFFKGMFVKQSQKYLDLFKAFAEEGKSVAS